MTEHTPDIFRNVHKGIRKALFDAVTALGRADSDGPRPAAAHEALASALRLVAQHGDNEDALLLPMLATRAPDLVQRLAEEHEALHREASELSARLNDRSPDELYTSTCRFTARYLAHMDGEERDVEPALRRLCTGAELAAFARESVARTAPEDQRMMLALMLPAMVHEDARALLARLPAELAESLRPLIS